MTLISPRIANFRNMLNINQTSLKVVTSLVLVFMVFNITISCIAAERQTERRKNIQPANRVDLFLDEYYPDEYMDRIFANKKETF